MRVELHCGAYLGYLYQGFIIILAPVKRAVTKTANISKGGDLGQRNPSLQESIMNLFLTASDLCYRLLFLLPLAAGTGAACSSSLM